MGFVKIRGKGKAKFPRLATLSATSMDDDDLCGVCADECVAEVMMPCQHSLCAACAAALKATHAKRVAAKCPYCSAFVERFEQVTPTNGLDDEAEIANMM